MWKSFCSTRPPSSTRCVIPTSSRPTSKFAQLRQAGALRARAARNAERVVIRGRRSRPPPQRPRQTRRAHPEVHPIQRFRLRSSPQPWRLMRRGRGLLSSSPTISAHAVRGNPKAELGVAGSGLDDGPERASDSAHPFPARSKVPAPVHAAESSAVLGRVPSSCLLRLLRPGKCGVHGLLERASR
jgi:hypothetical protein